MQKPQGTIVHSIFYMQIISRWCCNSLSPKQAGGHRQVVKITQSTESFWRLEYQDGECCHVILRLPLYRNSISHYSANILLIAKQMTRVTKLIINYNVQKLTKSTLNYNLQKLTKSSQFEKQKPSQNCVGTKINAVCTPSIS